MVKTTRDRIMPTAITGAHPWPLWFEQACKGGHSRRRWATCSSMSNIWMGRRDLSIFCT
jgi:hypothetical protein